MGTVHIGKQRFICDSLSLGYNFITFYSKVESARKIYLTDVLLRFYSDTNICEIRDFYCGLSDLDMLLFGNVVSATSKKCILVKGAVGSVYSRERFYSTTAEMYIKSTKSKYTIKHDNLKRTNIILEGSFDKVQITGPNSSFNLEVLLKSVKVYNIFSKGDILISGNLNKGSCQDTLYISR